jgi:hypothetical protein
MAPILSRNGASGKAGAVQRELHPHGPELKPSPTDRIAMRDFLLGEPHIDIEVKFFPALHANDPVEERGPFPVEGSRGIGMILYVRTDVPGRVAENILYTYPEWWGITYVGLELWATRSHGWRYVHPSFLNVGCRAMLRC